jgi:hypothetical protein
VSDCLRPCHLRPVRSDNLSVVRRYVIFGLLAVVWCCLWIMVGLILYLV